MIMDNGSYVNLSVMYMNKEGSSNDRGRGGRGGRGCQGGQEGGDSTFFVGSLTHPVGGDVSLTTGAAYSNSYSENAVNINKNVVERGTGSGF